LTVGNWRVQRLIAETVSPVETLTKVLEGVNGCDVAVSPSFAALRWADAGSVTRSAICRRFLIYEGA
jgi:hypothetical protein